MRVEYLIIIFNIKITSITYFYLQIFENKRREITNNLGSKLYDLRFKFQKEIIHQWL